MSEDTSENIKDQGGNTDKETTPKETASAEKFIVSSSPHARSELTVRMIMLGVIISLIPTFLSGLYVFGPRVILSVGVSVGFACLTEYCVQKIRKQKIKLSDLSVVLTGLLYAFTIPPALPLWINALGIIAAVLFGKALFGGLGHNIFNPALVGYAFLQATFPIQSTTWSAPYYYLKDNVDAISFATPLASMKIDHQGTDYFSMFMGGIGGAVGETSALAILIGGFYMAYKKYIELKMPLTVLGTVAVFSGILYLVDPVKYPDPLFQLLAGGLMLGAFYMVTDPVTSPTTPKGQIIFAVGVGMITVIIRIWGGYMEGVMYAILVMNSLVPLINRYTRPKIYGH